ncbi:hypothetical protein BLNAU_2401 [Blattamonas nauphoetae]|uniref:VPS37 C-terminal domain-containing protein n=1 Tax=Blattamonas nauphoetae TaxID=2049346 RepID=A0ABQ9YG56_9EUKA|nr:hypothetical protein BLNAU_2401 [Blattamonas nauphoetae]
MSSFLPPQPPTENENVFQQTASSLELLRARLEEESQSLQTTIQEEEDTLKTLLSSSSLSQQDLSTLFPQHYETQMLSITNVDELVEKVLVLQDNVEAAIQTAQTLDSLDVSGLIETLNSFDELAKQQRLLIEQSASMSSTSEPLQNTSFSMSFDEALAGLIGEFQTHAEKDRNTFQSLLTQLRREQAFFEREQAEFDSWSAELNAS